MPTNDELLRMLTSQSMGLQPDPVDEVIPAIDDPLAGLVQPEPVPQPEPVAPGPAPTGADLWAAQEQAKALAPPSAADAVMQGAITRKPDPIFALPETEPQPEDFPLKTQAAPVSTAPVQPASLPEQMADAKGVIDEGYKTRTEAAEMGAGAVDQEQAALEAKVEAENRLRASEAEAATQAAAFAADENRKVAAWAEKTNANITKREQEIASTPLDSGRAWRNKSAGQKVAGIFAAMASGFLSVHTGGRNLALEQIEKEIDRDLDIQRDERDAKLKALGGEKVAVAGEVERREKQNLLDLSTKKAMLTSGLTEINNQIANATTAQQAAQLEQTKAGFVDRIGQLEIEQGQQTQNMVNKAMERASKEAMLKMKLAAQAKKRGGSGRGKAPKPNTSEIYRRVDPFNPRSGADYKTSEGQHVITGLSFSVKQPDGTIKTFNKAEIAQGGEGKEKLQNRIAAHNKIKQATTNYVAIASELASKYESLPAVLTSELAKKFKIPNADYRTLKQAETALKDAYRVGGGFGASFTEGEAVLLTGTLFGSDPDGIVASTKLGDTAATVDRFINDREDLLRQDIATLLGSEVDPDSINFGSSGRALTKSRGAERKAKEAARAPKPLKDHVTFALTDDPDEKQSAFNAIDDMLAEARDFYATSEDTDEDAGSRPATLYTEKELKQIPKSLLKIIKESKLPNVRTKARNALKEFQTIRRKSYSDGLVNQALTEAQELSDAGIKAAPKKKKALPKLNTMQGPKY